MYQEDITKVETKTGLRVGYIDRPSQRQMTMDDGTVQNVSVSYFTLNDSNGKKVGSGNYNHYSQRMFYRIH